MLLVTNQDVLEEINDVNVVVDGLESFLGEEHLIEAGDPNVELYPVPVEEEHFTGEQFVEEATKRPDIACPRGADFLAAVILVTFLFGLDCEGEHLG